MGKIYKQIIISETLRL